MVMTLARPVRPARQKLAELAELAELKEKVIATDTSHLILTRAISLLPYVLAEGIMKNARTNLIMGLWEWVNYKVIIYGLPLKHHETFIGTRADNSGKEADACFRSSKPPNEPWPVKKYWLGNMSRVHDAIVIKIDTVSSGEVPTRMQFEFGTHNEYGNSTNIQQGQCVIKISLDCLYHDTDPIVLDFLLIRNEFLRMCETN
ncbi:3655_t:CDS:2 [Diversispora eburnea]|uniref:3655_t:CDS:1 n=1 Tax=Diversispora eburnea TaxID=1213867 RepID=A0A9N8ZDN6_9GLOM|nr:3655_t:CDS:2 [Diversispora eburnea]